MEHILYIAKNKLVWDDKYKDIIITEQDVMNNTKVFKKTMSKIINYIDCEFCKNKDNFYELGKKIMAIMNKICCESSFNNIKVKYILDAFVPIEEINITLPFKYLSNNITTIEEYFIFTRAKFEVDMDSCVKLLPLVNKKNIQSSYNTVKQYIRKTSIIIRSIWNLAYEEHIKLSTIDIRIMEYRDVIKLIKSVLICNCSIEVEGNIDSDKSCILKLLEVRNNEKYIVKHVKIKHKKEFLIEAVKFDMVYNDFIMHVVSIL